MKHNSKTNSFLSLVRIAFLMALVFTATSGFAQPQKVLPVGNVPDNIRTLLTDYSLHLNTGKTLHPSFYSSPMEAVIQDRRVNYKEFYSTGLHTSLVSIKSEFHMESAKVTVATKTLHIELLETVTMFGYPIINRAEDYPMIPAAQWAISHTDNDSVKQALERYILSTTYGVNDSISNGVEIVFRVRHSIDIELGAGQSQFTKDEFTDKENDNGDGFDNVAWVNGSPVRSKPDLMQMPDYVIYNTPVEVLGQQLLDDYTRAYGEASSTTPTSPTLITYGRTSASNYARTYSSNTTKTACSGILMDTTYYSQLAAYKTIWQYTTITCDDCADLVSQALRQGGFSTDSYWYFTGTGSDGHPGAYGWRVFDFSTYPGLAYYLQTTLGVITVYSSSTSLQLGDLSYTDGLHVVMVTGVAPMRYSGHTNDRKDYSWSSSLNHYWHIHDTIGG